MAVQKQLFELLEEQQEPFDSEAHKRLLRRTRINAVGFFKSILAKIVHRKGFAKYVISSSDSRSTDSGRPSVFSCFSETGALTPDVFSDPTAFAGGHGWRRSMEFQGEKPLSPVSVLQFLNHGFKEDNSSTASSFDSPREAPYADDSKTALRMEKQLMDDCAKEAEERIWESNGSLRAEATEKSINERIIAWRSLRGDMSSLGKLIGADMLEMSEDWSNFGAGVRNVGMEIDSAIFGEIVDEIVFDLLGCHCSDHL